MANNSFNFEDYEQDPNSERQKEFDFSSYEDPESSIHSIPKDYFHKQEKPYTTGLRESAGAFGRSAFRAVPQAMHNLFTKLGLPVVSQEELFPEFAKETESDKEHWIASMLGDVAGFGGIGGPTIAAARGIPAWSKLLSKAAPSIMKSAGVHGLEGAGLGALYSKPGEELEAAAFGGLLGAGAGALPAFIKKVPELYDRGKNITNIEPYKAQLKNLEESEKQAAKKHETYETESYITHGTKKPESLQRAINQANVEITEHKPIAESTPYKQKLLMKLREKPELLTETEVKALEPTAKDTLQEKEKKLLDISENFNKLYGEGEAHDVPIAEGITQAIEGKKNPKGKRVGGVKQEIGKEYDAIEDQFKNENIGIPNNNKIIELENKTRKQLEKSRGFFKDDDQFEKQILKIVEQSNIKPSIDIIPASEYLSNYRTIDKLSSRMRSKAYEVGITKDEQALRLKNADELDKTADEMRKILESHDLGPGLKQLKKTNKRWAAEVTPLYRNNLYQSLLKKGYGPENFHKALRGNAPGQKIMRDIIKKDPVLLKNILGQEYAGSPEKLLKPNVLIQEYAEKHPKFLKHKQSYKQALEEATKAKQEHQKSKEVTKKHAIRQKEEHAASKEAKKEHETIEKSKKIIEKNKKDIKSKEEQIKNLEHSLKNKELTARERLSIASKLDQARKDRAKLFKAAGGAIIGGYSINKAKKYFYG